MAKSANSDLTGTSILQVNVPESQAAAQQEGGPGPWSLISPKHNPNEKILPQPIFLILVLHSSTQPISACRAWWGKKEREG